MGITFGDGFYPNPNSTKNRETSPKMMAIPEHPFKENMLLSFYNWPQVETSAVLKASIENQSLKPCAISLPF
jgi:hypothetical protein